MNHSGDFLAQIWIDRTSVENGVRLNGSLQTPLVRGGSRLLLESPLGRVIVSSPGPALVESRTGDVYIVAHSNITMKTLDQVGGNLTFPSAETRESSSTFSPPISDKRKRE